ncbi:hypothetical protein I4F81_003155 [Pyropia yezoensis]|uniref:Uncharacterized protein n=1 Tax=Pyropia yezoensis TaxID=2788 RepID=A0ACC3BRM8_PYRYE|nr:hypothetical protein I4F81_003155 [Neopyropia yezoensis]
MDPVTAAPGATLPFVCPPGLVASASLAVPTRVRSKATVLPCRRVNLLSSASAWSGHLWRPRTSFALAKYSPLPLSGPVCALSDKAAEPRERRSSGFPHNTSDFRTWRARGDYYRDNTKFVRFLDSLVDSPHVALYRPPRFGKSLLCSMIQAYYDVADKDSFHELFDGLDIGAHPTEHASSYYVLALDLSVVPSGTWTVQEAFGEMNRVINESCIAFKRRYGLSFNIVKNAVHSVANACRAVAALKDNKMYIILDEYDRLPNAVMSEGPRAVKDYEAILCDDAEAAKVCARDVAEPDGESVDDVFEEWYTCSSPIRALYSLFKNLTDKPGKWDYVHVRTFTTGISPVALADASIFNVAKNLTAMDEAWDVLGFTRDDVAAAIDRANMVPASCREALLELLSSWFNDLRFFVRDSFPTLFHPMLCMLVLSDLELVRSSRSKMSEILGMQLPDCDELRPGGPALIHPTVRHPLSQVEYMPSAVVDLANVTVNNSVVELFSKRLLAGASFSFDELFREAEVPVALLQVAFKQSELLNLSSTENGRAVDRMRLLLLYHGMLTCCGMVSRVGADGKVAEYYRVRTSNVAASLAARPLETQLVGGIPRPLDLLQNPTEELVTEYIQLLCETGVRRVNEASYQQGILAWIKSWSNTSRRTDIKATVEVPVRLVGSGLVRYVDFELRDDSSGRALIIELKHIPLSAIEKSPWRSLKGGMAGLTNFLRGKNDGISLSTDQLLALRIKPSWKPHRLPAGKEDLDLCVKDVCDGAMEQLQEQVAMYRRKGTLYAFVVVVIHRRVLTLQLSEPRLP